MIQEYRAWDKYHETMVKVIALAFKKKIALVEKVDGNRYEIHFDNLIFMPTVGQDEELSPYYTNDVIIVTEERTAFGFYQEIEFVGVVKFSDEEKCYFLDLIKRPINRGDDIPDEIDGIKIANMPDDESVPTTYHFYEGLQPEDITVLGNIFETEEYKKFR